DGEGIGVAVLGAGELVRVYAWLCWEARELVIVRV
ncbi:MAG: hypothetical protein JWN34_3387, partial [Bryobacterales bacterium]|nr:hypothetical protein [Bryobacterales bacterium]